MVFAVTDIIRQQRTEPSFHRRQRRRRTAARTLLRTFVSGLVVPDTEDVRKAIQILGPHHSRSFLPRQAALLLKMVAWKCQRCKRENKVSATFCGGCGLRWDEGPNSSNVTSSYAVVSSMSLSPWQEDQNWASWEPSSAPASPPVPTTAFKRCRSGCIRWQRRQDQRPACGRAHRIGGSFAAPAEASTGAKAAFCCSCCQGSSPCDREPIAAPCGCQALGCSDLSCQVLEGCTAEFAAGPGSASAGRFQDAGQASACSGVAAANSAGAAAQNPCRQSSLRDQLGAVLEAAGSDLGLANQGTCWRYPGFWGGRGGLVQAARGCYNGADKAHAGESVGPCGVSAVDPSEDVDKEAADSQMLQAERCTAAAAEHCQQMQMALQQASAAAAENLQRLAQTAPGRDSSRTPRRKRGSDHLVVSSSDEKDDPAEDVPKAILVDQPPQ